MEGPTKPAPCRLANPAERTGTPLEGEEEEEAGTGHLHQQKQQWHVQCKLVFEHAENCASRQAGRQEVGCSIDPGSAVIGAYMHSVATVHGKPAGLTSWC